MATTVGDFKIASLAAGFTLGFGFLTVWTAIKQTTRLKNPVQSTYVWMIWGEILANIGIGLLGWLFIEGIIPPGLVTPKPNSLYILPRRNSDKEYRIPVLFGLLFCWVFEIQLLMQVIINRIYVVAENRNLVVKVKWATAGFITLINIMVFCIWIPAHLTPPPSET